MSQRDIENALLEALSVEKTGKTVVNEVCKRIRPAFEKWQNRDLVEYEVKYLLLDGLQICLFYYGGRDGRES